jgi:hypothetical protein
MLIVTIRVEFDASLTPIQIKINNQSVSIIMNVINKSLLKRHKSLIYHIDLNATLLLQDNYKTEAKDSIFSIVNTH